MNESNHTNDQIIEIAARVAAKRRGMSVAIAKELLLLGTEPTYENAILFSRQRTLSSDMGMA